MIISCMIISSHGNSRVPGVGYILLTPVCGLRWFRWFFTTGLHPLCRGWNHLRSPYYTSQLLGLGILIAGIPGSPAAYTLPFSDGCVCGYLDFRLNSAAFSLILWKRCSGPTHMTLIRVFCGNYMNNLSVSSTYYIDWFHPSGRDYL